MLLKELSALASPLSQGQVDKLKQLTSELSSVQLAWVSGYLAASANQGQSGVETTTETSAAPTVTILYGSQTGNGRGVAKELAAKAQAQGYAVNLASMGEYNVRQLKQETILLLLVSTHGEGEAPDDAIELHKFLTSKRAPKLDNLHYSVLALGDSSYEFFCQTGKDFDARLSALGATSLLPLVECDVDYEDISQQWQDSVVEAVKPYIQASSASVVSIGTASVAGESEYTKQNPYTAEVLVSQKITGRDSDRDVRHVEIDLGESGLTYQVGDALGVWFSNNQALVDEVIAALGLAADDNVTVAKESLSLKAALTDKKELTQLYPGLVKTWAELSGNAELAAIGEDKEQTRQFILQHQLADLVAVYPAKVSATQLVGMLRPLTPRLYSIASSQAEVEAEVHLTVALVEDERQGQARFGGASHFLASAQEGQQINVYVEQNNHFRLPENPQTPVIMVGPGTGVAPFRAFMQQRAADGVSGDSWLFFGNPHFEQDFLYQVEWQQYLKNGGLSRLDVAFSRDQADKVYVQHRIAEQAEALWQWLQKGAHVYICGDAERMAKDVHQALVNIAVEQGGLSFDDAEAYFETLRSEKRYQKDVY
ncbi:MULTISPECIES: assimilatory sulfite reductase (NADPH) flavoprotein subunit [Shewanella]|jgi:sulfite reductase (NADPH) flavoprotein alpha-component|uniref:Sulfite reductase [NADPH] flavoprotein alpha-component n=2 Tax=Gammaproteobacteria TaxID=1236 RepID=A0A3N4DTM4_9GAMM|nr:MULTISPECIES: assimilatory sulfite reductase (NADPH) flavoprotein subunit [Shewanella]AZG33627.1 assimilatory sulfite reductase (NADPH) flavoprotein subunit [Shewanella psychromarinicola]MCL1082119.1 assimilatory sulfite reductase (NADPH) flavoprotein subunit [Shewanella psychromarinicola]PKG78685.1 assimilatory sulfite reductase (NADPH) flavoprotein subunit [Shewanella sp. Actino-trap-3]RPA27952.1 assimilatory sulfite reductase (NADPH) flavoprotein subunit [Shewanella psychromarinicola]|tara:strand:- start:44706 stop:46496 length:1791 start_codon:yes stop_codon:yes gene_type:complete